MRSDDLPDDLEKLWKELGANPTRISPGDLRKGEEKLQRELRRRSLIGGGAAAIVIASFTLFFFVFHHTLLRIGSLLVVAATVYTVVQLLARRARHAVSLAETASVTFYRAELERQRDFHRGTWFWSRLLTLQLAGIVWLVGFAQANPRLAAFIWTELAALLILGVVAVPLNLRLARNYQRRIDALDAVKATQ